MNAITKKHHEHAGIVARCERCEAIEHLRQWIKPGDRVYTILRHVSASGMSRSISLVVATADDSGPEIVDLDYWAVRAMGDRIDQRRGGIKVGGCGMDMGSYLVYNLSWTLFGHGFTCTGPGCPSNDHSNPPYPERDGTMTHSDSGYALHQSWL